MSKINMAAFAAAVLMAGGAQAATLNYTVNDSFSGGAFPTSGSLSLDKFDASVGTLLSVSFEITFGVDSQGTVQNQSAASGNYAFTLSTFTNLSGFYSEFISDSTAENYAIASGSTSAVDVSYSDIRAGSLSVVGAEGPGTFTLNYNLAGSAGAAGPTPFVFTSTGSTTFVNAAITYTYDAPAVPLPAALPLLGGGLALMGFVARRRRA